MISQKGIDFIKKAEGFVPHAYPDAGGLSIGYGCYLHSPEEIRKYEGKTITEAEGTQLLLNFLNVLQDQISKVLKVTVNQNQFDALCSFSYNIGFPAFRNSTMLKLLNAGQYLAAADEFARWNKVKKVEDSGLTKRRAAEKELFLS